ncbi:MAG: hypothetical protein ACM3UU_11760 [Ignavibacteriales bacterium]
MKTREKINSENDEWFCPAIENTILHGLCWEYCFASIGGPKDTEEELERWIATDNKFKSIDDFHEICKKCEHCQWPK